ncbi:MAG: malto-oligosyltrehalose synthase [Nitrospira sp.]|nr:malto-oligosyltrehalose synthase [Nitrospira sp.]
MPDPLATYRLQMHAGFTLNDATAIVPYLRELGVSHCYSSPILQAAKGSTHGYDVLDHTRVNHELGGEEAFKRFNQELRTHQLGLLLDIVPNHMAIGGRESVWWWDVLENGQASRYAPYFDVEWQPPESKLHHMVMVPILSDHYGRVLDTGEIHVARHGGSFTIQYHDHVLPLAPRSIEFILKQAADVAASDMTAFFADALEQLPSSRTTDWVSLRRRHRDKGILLDLLARFLREDEAAASSVDRCIERLNQDTSALHELLERQNYRLAFWRTSSQDLGYRRFFDINTLVGLRTEDERVFADIHQRLFDWLAPDGPVDGVRVDHPDGLQDPQQYLERLQARVSSGWIVVEKILIDEEQLPESWPVSGTTGYDFMNLVLGLFMDPSSEESLTRFYGEFSGETRTFAEVLREKKDHVLRHVLGSDLNILTSMLWEICEQHTHHRDYTRHELHEAIREYLVEFPVYRAYVRPQTGEVSEHDQRVVTRAFANVSARRTDLGQDLLLFIRDLLLLIITGEREGDFVTRFQQITGPVMAKGAEDTAFYCYHRFIALNEVGGNPGRFGTTIDQFHQWCEHRHWYWPKTMLGTSTHDTKRSEDVRARLAALTEIPARWITQITQWSQQTAKHWGAYSPDRNFEYFFFQTLVGAWPLEKERALAYAEKIIREAKLHTSWTAPQKEYEQAIRTYVTRLYEDPQFIDDLTQFAAGLEPQGQVTSLSQTLLKLTAPGIPDLYQGTELWSYSLVDPDNRRPVDYGLRKTLLRDLEKLSADEIWQRRKEGLPKLWLIRQGLRLRRNRPKPFGPHGDYLPLYAEGEKGAHVVSFLRGGEVVAIAPRLFSHLGDAWEDTTISLPEGRWHHELDGRHFDGGRCWLRELLSSFPVALLSKQQ